MNIKNMYENNKKMDELKDMIANHNSVIASGRNVSEDYYQQLEGFKKELAGMKEIPEEEIDKKVSEYEKIVEKYEKNNNRMNELKGLIENHNAIIASGRNVSEDFYKQLEGFKEELAGMKEIPKSEIMPYKRQLAIAYKHKLENVHDQNKKYDQQKEIVDTSKSIIMSGREVGTKYGDQYVENVNKLNKMKRISDEEINKWKKVLDEVAQDDKEIAQLEDLIKYHTSRIMSGQEVGPNYEKQLEDLKKELAERKKWVDLGEETKEQEKNEKSDLTPDEKPKLIHKLGEALKRFSRPANSSKETVKEEKDEENSLTVVEKPNIMQRIGMHIKNFGVKVSNLFKKQEPKIQDQQEQKENGHKKFSKELGNTGDYSEKPLSDEEMEKIEKGLEKELDNSVEIDQK